MPGQSASPVPMDVTTRLRMQTQPSRDTQQELALRRLVWSEGLRYRVDHPVLPRRRADLAFTRARVAVFVDGCFWHACPEHGRTPTHNAEWWARKLSANVERDMDTTQRLQLLGWTVIRVWEHEDPVAAAERVANEVRRRQAGKGH